MTAVYIKRKGIAAKQTSDCTFRLFAGTVFVPAMVKQKELDSATLSDRNNCAARLPE
jgi:hypothetical protein